MHASRQSARAQNLVPFIPGMSGLVAYWPLDDATSAARVLNPAVTLGRNICVNGTFGADVTWTKGSGWSIAGGVGGASAAAVSANLSQSLTNYMIVGRTYRVTYTISGYSAGSIQAKCGSTGSGTTRSANGTYVEDIVCGGTSTFIFTPLSTFTGNIDDVSIQEVNPVAFNDQTNLAGAGTGPVTGQGGGLLGNLQSFDGSNDFVNIFTASLNSILPVTEGSLVIFGRVPDLSVWSDATARRMVTLQIDANNRIYMEKRTTSNSIGLNYAAGGTTSTVNVTSFSPASPFMAGMSWSKTADQMIGYANGLQQGAAQTGLGTLPLTTTNNLTTSTAVIGASSNAGAAPWSGLLGHCALFNRPITAAEMRELARQGGCIN